MKYLVVSCNISYQRTLIVSVIPHIFPQSSLLQAILEELPLSFGSMSVKGEVFYCFTFIEKPIAT